VLAPVLSLFLIVSTASPSPNRVMLMPLVAGEGVKESTADAVTDAVAGELRRVPGLQVLTRKEVSAVLSLERQKALVGCQSDSCVAELSGALDVDRLITGNVAKVGESWILHLQLVDAKKVATIANSDRRKRGGVIDDVLDELPAMVKELFANQPKFTAEPSAQQAQAAPQNTQAQAAPQNTQEQATTPPPPAPPKAKKDVAQRWADLPLEEPPPGPLSLATDGKGHYVAYVPGNIDVLYVGTTQKLYAQRIVSGGSEGDKRLEFYFWEPRTRAPAEAEFQMREGKFTLTCAKKQLAFTPVPKAQGDALLKKMKLFKPRWQRRGYAIARDEEGVYYYVDHLREPDDNTDFQLYIGEAGSLVPVETRVVASDRDGDIFGTPDGKLRFSHQAREAEWMQNGTKHKLKYFDIVDLAQDVYTKFGVYKGESLGTPCDWLL